MEQPVAYPRFLPVGDAALSVELGDAIAPEINAAVVALDIRLAASEIEGIVETIPAFRSLLVCYDPEDISYRGLVNELRKLVAQGRRPLHRNSARWTIPVAYESPFATDLNEVAERLGMPTSRVIELHGSAEYSVYTVGFAPGIPVMGGLPAELHIPRRPNPRPSVPAGAVVIGGMQASIISIPVPSGWYILGQTPVRAFDPRRADPFLFGAGDVVRFRRIDAAEYETLADLSSDDMLAIVREPA